MLGRSNELISPLAVIWTAIAVGLARAATIDNAIIIPPNVDNHVLDLIMEEEEHVSKAV